MYDGQQLTPVLPGSNLKVGTEERKKWLFTQQAYVQIPLQISIDYPVKTVIDMIKKEIRLNTSNEPKTIRTTKAECDSNYERIIMHIPGSYFNIAWNTSLEKILYKTKFYIAHIYRHDPRKVGFKILLCRSPSRSVNAQ